MNTERNQRNRRATAFISDQELEMLHELQLHYIARYKCKVRVGDAVAYAVRDAYALIKSDDKGVTSQRVSLATTQDWADRLVATESMDGGAMTIAEIIDYFNLTETPNQVALELKKRGFEQKKTTNKRLWLAKIK